LVPGMRMRATRFKSLVGLAILISARSPANAEGVRSELSRLQKDSGLSLTWYLSGVTTARFADRSVTKDKESPPAGKFENALLSPDGEEIAFPASGIQYGGQRSLTIANRGTPVVREYPESSDASAACWSHDKSKLVVYSTTADTRPPQYRLFILDLTSRALRQFGDIKAYATQRVLVAGRQADRLQFPR
jgi:hypothetical protein